MYSIDVLIHKSDPQCAEIQRSVDEALNNGFPNGLPHEYKTCWKDCAIVEPENTALRDYMCLKVSTDAEKERPPVVDFQLKPILDPGTPINGKIVWITGNLGTFLKQHVSQDGVKVYLNGTCVTNENSPIPLESISSKPSVEQMFGDVVTPSGAPSTQMPTAAPVAQMPTAAPAPVAPAPVSTPTAPQYQMTPKASGATRDAFIAQGWTDELLIQEGYMMPPNGVTPSFS
jgi:hypothetical protein